MSIVIITGSRHWQDKDALFAALDAEHRKQPLTLLVEGGAKGADDLAALWAYKRGIKHVCMPADWQTYKKKAGPIRNIEMLDTFPEARVVAFPLPDSVGTKHCMKAAEKRRMPVINYGH